MQTNTSIHNLNSDNKLSIPGQIWWMIINFINNNNFPNKSGDLEIKRFFPDIKTEDWEKIHVKSSPSRALSDLFWINLNWDSIKSEIGDINVFDTGAGKGGYGLKLNSFSGGLSSYFGVDVSPHKEWENLMSENNFISLIKHRSKNILDVIPKDTNFFMTQSAIEHFEDDLLYFDQVRTFIKKSKKNTIQIHLFPSAACLKLYLTHGVRQYTPNTVSKITQLFASTDEYSMLFKLGGSECNNLHYKYITRPLITSLGKVDWRNEKTEEYFNKLKVAVEKDINCENNNPSFYALIIHSNYNKPIFKEMESLTK